VNDLHRLAQNRWTADDDLLTRHPTYGGPDQNLKSQQRNGIVFIARCLGKSCIVAGRFSPLSDYVAIGFKHKHGKTTGADQANALE
jgi:hypothetical protein